MTVPMDNTVAPPFRELAEHLYRKNIELETNLRKLSKSRVPSDPNTWFQIRENYESIILEDHDFSEKHDIELALWQLHYRKIEEFRALLHAAKSLGSVSTEGGRNPPKPESIKKIRTGFKTFLSESTGFYHDLIVKIKEKYGLPLGLFSDGPDSQIIVSKDEKKSTDMKKGMMSCHRSLIYLGDLARYKGSYGEGDSISCEFAASSSYYTQAASLFPSSGNPHHQLAIIASYSGDDLVSVYRYFRSLAVDIPFSTARDNLILAFEKNRQSFSMLPSNSNTVKAKPSPARSKGRGRGRADARPSTKTSKPHATTVTERELNTSQVLKSFCIRFVRFNGILFTRTSLETFGEVFTSVKKDLLSLLSSGPTDKLNFGPDTTENALLLVRLISILIFTAHNVSKESENQSYAETLQRPLLLQNAYTSAFEFAALLIKRSEQLHDVTSSFLLPAILTFTEWLACHHDIAAGSDEKQAGARSLFWNHLITLVNKITCGGLDEEETGNSLALWEDFELRGFAPLMPAQGVLNFSVKRFGSKRARAQRLLAAVRALTNVIRIDQKAVYFDRCSKKFVIGVEPEMKEDEEEEIVFKPCASFSVSNNRGELQGAPSYLQLDTSATTLEPLQKVNLNTCKWLMEQVAKGEPKSDHYLNTCLMEQGGLSSAMKNLGVNGNGGFGGPPVSSMGLLNGGLKAPVSRPPVSSMGLLNGGLKAHVSRPVRHVGPPPGFGNRVKSEDASLHFDDYSWLDGYEAPSAVVENGNGGMKFPFPGNFQAEKLWPPGYHV